MTFHHNGIFDHKDLNNGEMICNMMKDELLSIQPRTGKQSYASKYEIDCIMNSKFAKDELDHWIDGIHIQMQTSVEVDHSQFKDMVNSMLDDRYHGQVFETYFYHGDHLGSASWITDRHGEPVQHLAYLPFGEELANERMSGYSERFTFTGKELDAETGYSYFGARYYDPATLSAWLSVDPMSDKYPSISPYAYCAWNPLRLVDPEGKDVWEINNQGELIWKQASNNDEFYKIDEKGNRVEGNGNSLVFNQKIVTGQLSLNNGDKKQIKPQIRK